MRPFSFADIVQRVSPAVVSIDVTESGRAGEPTDGQGEGDQGQMQAPGSGFFISSNGYILTNNHVAGDADTISVRLKDGRTLQGHLVGRDKATDLAVVKVDGVGFPFVSFEDKSRPRVGDWVVAIGNPYDLGGTATAGIVSAYDRNIGQQFIDYMQIDAPINRGNSGGPTFDVDGRVVGVNTAIFSPSGGSIGIGFAIPASLAQNVAQQLVRTGHVERGYLGATVQSVTPEVAQSLGRPDLRGALIADVLPNGPAAAAGLQAGDVVTAVDGALVSTADALTQRVAQARVGQTLGVQALRNGRTLDAQVRSGRRPPEERIIGTVTPGADEEYPSGPG